ncbi:MAG TPA: glycoside hydrolase domain-containing protein, partial [Streptosporangiaceae bacterium]|nr:glycoside hydrolase domain-containing protein [Streptosporangiaceae bacterium]
TADLALSFYARARGDATDAAMLRKRANNWAHVFDPASRLLVPRLKNGRFVTGVKPTTTYRYVEGDAYEYLWDVPNNYAGLFAKLGGAAKVAPALGRYLAVPNGQGMHAFLSNEFGLGEQFALDYAGNPAGTQFAVNTIRDSLYRPGPAGLRNNDDLGAESSQFIWEMLGMYPENPGTGTLVLASPGFPRAVITLPGRKTITITAPGASPARYYVTSLRINGTAYHRLYIPYTTLAAGATLNFSLGTKPASWGSSPLDAPPSYR